ncbi:MAG: ATP-binding protein [Desulfurivibrio sp.]|nr:MAG: ATP-binding protein [Desulfurivibrio sp.]
MDYKHFRTNCTIRLVLISGTIVLLVYLLSRTDLVVTPLIVGLTAAAQAASLYRYVEKSNRELARFLESIKYSDFSQSFTSPVKGAAFQELGEAFSGVIKEFQRARSEKEEQYRYLQTVVQHVGIGLLAYRDNGDIELINGAAKRLLGEAQLTNLRQLGGLSADLEQKLREIQTGEKAQIKLIRNDSLQQLSIYATKFRLRQESYTLVSLQNIQPELEEKEMEAWQNLIRVLTHEIMNSITPIASLASTANSLLVEKLAREPVPDGTLCDVGEAVKTIERRSRNLMNFVDDYRRLTRIPKPNFEIVPVRELLERIMNLMKEPLDSRKIHCSLQVDPSTLELTADPALIEQVLINLSKNAVEALAETELPRITLRAVTDEHGNPVIQVTDNGPGLNAEVLEKIFIPFFTTKPDGSGIGLSLSRQIMRLHGGTLSVVSRPHEETIFTLRF